ncbi:MAG: hypothetical protein INQ03_19115 [Candidatus Heimdallarchaeota archaeon]|nr:hypothetical protein [Candidatus Heimdallarchaeota archaeon]
MSIESRIIIGTIFLLGGIVLYNLAFYFQMNEKYSIARSRNLNWIGFGLYVFALGQFKPEITVLEPITKVPIYLMAVMIFIHAYWSTIRVNCVKEDVIINYQLYSKYVWVIWIINLIALFILYQFDGTHLIQT